MRAYITSAKNYAAEGLEMIVGPVPKPDDSTVEGFPTYNFVREFVLMREQHETGEAADRINRAAWEFMKFLLLAGTTGRRLRRLRRSAAGQGPAGEPALYRDFGQTWVRFARRVRHSTPPESMIYDMNTHLESESMGELQKSYLDLVYLKEGTGRSRDVGGRAGQRILLARRDRDRPER